MISKKLLLSKGAEVSVTAIGDLLFRNTSGAFIYIDKSDISELMDFLFMQETLVEEEGKDF